MTTKVRGITFRYSHTIGRREFNGLGFRNPVALARGEEDRIYVVSRSLEYRPDGKRVTICTVGEDFIGEFARGVTTAGELKASDADGSLIWPTSVALDKEGRVYVADEWLNRISVFTRDGEWLSKWGTPGNRDGEIDHPSGLAFDAEDNIYLVDSGNSRVQKLSKDGRFLAKWGTAGSGDGEFHLPWGIDIDSNGDVYVADWGNHRIQKFSPEGQFLMKFGTAGTGDGCFTHPTGVAVDKDGVIYVADWGNDRLQVFDADGKFATKITGNATISKWGIEKLDANPDMWKEREVAHDLEQEVRFSWPIAVEVDDKGRVFVLECGTHRIQTYRKVATFFLGLYDDARL